MKKDAESNYRKNIIFILIMGIEGIAFGLLDWGNVVSDLVYIQNKQKILNLGWNLNEKRELEDKSNIIIIGTEKYIEDINNQINQNNIKDATIIDCYNFEDVKQDIKKIINEHDSSLNTLGFYDM